MSKADPIELLFGGMDKLGPGSDADTRAVLKRLPQREYKNVVDAGCGSGKQTVTLAAALSNAHIYALDTHEPFLHQLEQRLTKVGLDSFVTTATTDISLIGEKFSDLDLIWAEASAYSIGFDNALASWRDALKPDGLLVVSELCWLRDPDAGNLPKEAVKFWATEYPAMRSVDQNIAACEAIGYEVLDTYTLPRESWTDDYYDVLKPRAQVLLEHEDSTVVEWAAQTLKEIEVFENTFGSYDYVFFILQKQQG